MGYASKSKSGTTQKPVNVRESTFKEVSRTDRGLIIDAPDGKVVLEGWDSCHDIRFQNPGGKEIEMIYQKGIKLPPERIMAEFEALPEPLKENIDMFTVINHAEEGVNPDPEKFTDTQGWLMHSMPHHIVLTDAPLNVDGPGELQHVLSHEAGHSFTYFHSEGREKERGTPDIIERWKTVADDKPVTRFSKYMKENEPENYESEDISESISLKIAHPESFKKDHPRKYAILEEYGL